MIPEILGGDKRGAPRPYNPWQVRFGGPEVAMLTVFHPFPVETTHRN